VVCSENLGIGLASAVDQPERGDRSGTSDVSISVWLFCHPYFKKARAASGFCLPGAAVRLPRRPLPARAHAPARRGEVRGLSGLCLCPHARARERALVVVFG
jgi:hypothetical protein